MKRNQELSVAVRRGVVVGGIAGAAVIGKLVVKLLAFGAGAAVVRSTMGYLRETPEGRETIRGMTEISDPTNLLLPYKDSSETWFQQQGTIAAGFNLTASEQSELAEIRIQVMQQIPDSLCSRIMWSGSATASEASSALQTLTPEVRRRIGYLTGKAIGRRFTNTPVDVTTYSQNEWIQFVSQYATDDDLDLIENAEPQQANPSVRCRAAQAIYQIALRAPTDSEQRTRALHYLLRNGATEPPAL
jgi:hypothetical protein